MFSSKSSVLQLLFISLFIVTFVFVNAQSPSVEWKKSYGGSAFDGNDFGEKVSVCYTSDGGSITAGDTYSSNGFITGFHGAFDIWVVKLNANGNLKWQKCYGGSNGEYPRRIQQTSDGGYIIVGSSASNDGDVTVNHGNDDVWVIKIDANGNIQWQRSLGGSNFDEGEDIRQTEDSGYIIACETSSGDGDVIGKTYGNNDYWIVKLTKEGVIEWQKLYGGNSDDKPRSIVQTFDNGFIVVGTTFSTNISGYHGGAGDAWAIKLDSVGNLEWGKCIGGSAYEEGMSIKQLADSNFIVATSTSSFDGDVIGNHGGTDYFIVKLDKAGSIIWKKCFGSTKYEYVSDIETPDESFVIAGYSNSTSGEVTGNHGNSDYWILKADSIGNIIWETSLGGSGIDEAFDIIYKQGKGYLIGGESNSTDGDINDNHGNYDFWIVKLKDDAILPVTFLNFTAQKQNNITLLQWQTTNEINNDHFNIERCSDSKAFYSIGSVNALSNSKINTYSFTDNAPLKEKNYYRLKQVDKDGKFTYSNIVSVDFTNVASAFSISPNPASNSVKVSLPVINAPSQIVVYDVTGKKITDEKVDAGVDVIQVDISRFHTGTYTIVLIQNNKKQTLKLIKQE